SAARIVELRRGHAEIEKHAIQSVSRFLPITQFCKTRMTNAYPRVLAEVRACLRDRLRVLVHQQQAAVLAQAPEDLARMATATKRAIEIGAFRLDLQRLDHLLQHDRRVREACLRHACFLMCRTRTGDRACPPLSVPR